MWSYSTLVVAECEVSGCYWLGGVFFFWGGACDLGMRLTPQKKTCVKSPN